MSGFLAQSAVILVEVWMIGQLGTEPLAAIALVFPLLILLLTFSGGAVGGAISSSVARYLGAGNRDRAIKAAMVGAGLAAAIGAGIGLPLALGPMAWIPLFASNADVASMTTTYIQYAGPCYAFLAVGLVLYFAAQGAGRMRWPVIATFVRFSVAVGGAYVWVTQGGGFEAIIMMAAAGIVLYGSIIALSLKLGAWR